MFSQWQTLQKQYANHEVRFNEAVMWYSLYFYIFHNLPSKFAFNSELWYAVYLKYVNKKLQKRTKSNSLALNLSY